MTQFVGPRNIAPKTQVPYPKAVARPHPNMAPMVKGFIIALLLGLLLAVPARAGDIVIRNVTVVDVVNAQIRPGQEIIVQNGKIQKIHAQPPQGTIGDRTIDGSALVALPGFVNTHTHLWQHLAKGFYPNGNLQEWVRIYRYAHYLEAQELYDATLAAACEGLLSGITTVADFASVNFSEFSLDATARAITDASMGGALVYWNAAAFLPHEVKGRELKDLQLRFPQLDLWMGHGPFSFFPIPAVYDAISQAKTLQLPMTEHTMENVREQRDFYRNLSRYLLHYGQRLAPGIRDRLARLQSSGAPSKVDGVEWVKRLATEILANDQDRDLLSDKEKAMLGQWVTDPGISPVPLLESMGAFEGPYISVHSVWQTQRDMDIYKKYGVAVSHNPESNMYLSSGIAPILEYLKNDIPVTLATDGAASNDGINFFSAMRGMWNLQKLAVLDTAMSRRLTAWEVIRAATINGAKALGLEERTGSLDVGKEADITLLSRARLKMAPYVPQAENVLPLIIYSATPEAVETVISDGTIVVENRYLTRSPPEVDLAARLSAISNRVNQRHNTGKTWRAKFQLNRAHLTPDWHRYRSVRKKDTLDLTFANSGKEPITIYLAFSGTPFGGNTAAMLSRATLAAYPLNRGEEFWDRNTVLEPGQELKVSKTKGSYKYTIEIPRKKLIRIGRPEQILVLVKPE